MLRAHETSTRRADCTLCAAYDRLLEILHLTQNIHLCHSEPFTCGHIEPNQYVHCLARVPINYTHQANAYGSLVTTPDSWTCEKNYIFSQLYKKAIKEKDLERFGNRIYMSSSLHMHLTFHELIIINAL